MRQLKLFRQRGLQDMPRYIPVRCAPEKTENVSVHLEDFNFNNPNHEEMTRQQAAADKIMLQNLANEFVRDYDKSRAIDLLAKTPHVGSDEQMRAWLKRAGYTHAKVEGGYAPLFTSRKKDVAEPRYVRAMYINVIKELRRTVEGNLR